MAASDANGNRARYEYDAAGRVVRQTVIEASAAHPARRQTVTTWSYDGTRLVALDHPVQSERFRHDERGQVVARTVMLRTAAGAMLTSVTRYRHDAQGRLTSVSLADGSVIDHRRNGQGQIVALTRSRVQTPWLAWLLPAEVIAEGIERDLVGLRRFRYGNGIEAEFQRSREGVLARTAYRRPRSSAGAPGVADDARALIDQRYLWDVQGNLLQSRGKEQVMQYAYDAQDRLIVAETHRATRAEAGVIEVGASTRMASRPETVARFFFDGVGNRLLSQQPASHAVAASIGSVTDTGAGAFHAAGRADAGAAATAGGTVRAHYAPQSNRWVGRTRVRGKLRPQRPAHSNR